MPSQKEISLQQMEERLKNKPDSLVFSRIADSYRKIGDVQQAIAICLKGLEPHPEYVTGRIILGRCYLEQENLENAMNEFIHVCRLDRYNQIAIKMIADIYAKQGLTDKAGDLYNILAGMDPENPSVNQLAGEFKGTNNTDLFKVLGIEPAASTTQSTAEQIDTASTGEENVSDFAADMLETDTLETDNTAPPMGVSAGESETVGQMEDEDIRLEEILSTEESSDEGTGFSESSIETGNEEPTDNQNQIPEEPGAGELSELIPESEEPSGEPAPAESLDQVEPSAAETTEAVQQDELLSEVPSENDISSRMDSLFADDQEPAPDEEKATDPEMLSGDDDASHTPQPSQTETSSGDFVDRVDTMFNDQTVDQTEMADTEEDEHSEELDELIVTEEESQIPVSTDNIEIDQIPQPHDHDTVQNEAESTDDTEHQELDLKHEEHVVSQDEDAELAIDELIVDAENDQIRDDQEHAFQTDENETLFSQEKQQPDQETEDKDKTVPTEDVSEVSNDAARTQTDSPEVSQEPAALEDMLHMDEDTVPEPDNDKRKEFSDSDDNRTEAEKLLKPDEYEQQISSQDQDEVFVPHDPFSDSGSDSDTLNNVINSDNENKSIQDTSDNDPAAPLAQQVIESSDQSDMSAATVDHEKESVEEISDESPFLEDDALEQLSLPKEDEPVTEEMDLENARDQEELISETEQQTLNELESVYNGAIPDTDTTQTADLDIDNTHTSAPDTAARKNEDESESDTINTDFDSTTAITDSEVHESDTESRDQIESMNQPEGDSQQSEKTEIGDQIDSSDADSKTQAGFHYENSDDSLATEATQTVDRDFIRNIAASENEDSEFTMPSVSASADEQDILTGDEVISRLDEIFTDNQSPEDDNMLPAEETVTDIDTSSPLTASTEQNPPSDEDSSGHFEEIALEKDTITEESIDAIPEEEEEYTPVNEFYTEQGDGVTSTSEFPYENEAESTNDYLDTANESAAHKTEIDQDTSNDDASENISDTAALNSCEVSAENGESTDEEMTLDQIPDEILDTVSETEFVVQEDGNVDFIPDEEISGEITGEFYNVNGDIAAGENEENQHNVSNQASQELSEEYPAIGDEKNGESIVAVESSEVEEVLAEIPDEEEETLVLGDFYNVSGDSIHEADTQSFEENDKNDIMELYSAESGTESILPSDNTAPAQDSSGTTVPGEPSKQQNETQDVTSIEPDGFSTENKNESISALSEYSDENNSLKDNKTPARGSKHKARKPGNSTPKNSDGTDSGTRENQNGKKEQNVPKEKKNVSTKADMIPDHVLTPTLADIYFQQDQPYLAVQIYKRLLEKNPDNEKIVQRIQQIEQVIAQREELMESSSTVDSADDENKGIEKKQTSKQSRSSRTKKPLKGKKIKKKVKEQIKRARKRLED